MEEKVDCAAELAQLRWRCRRGMRELDLLVGRWLEENYAGASAAEQLAFRRLLEQPDPMLLAWLTGREIPQDSNIEQIVKLIRRDD